MRTGVVISKSGRSAVAIALVCSLPLGCSDAVPEDDASGDGPADTAADPPDDGVTGADQADPPPEPTEVGMIAETGHAATIAVLTDLLPADTRGVSAVDVGSLLSGESAVDVTALLNGEGADPALDELFGAVGRLAGSVEGPAVMTSALLAHTTDAADGMLLLAALRSDTIDDVVAGPVPTPDGTYGTASHALYVDENGNHLTLLPGGVLLVGSQAVVESVVDIVDGTTTGGASVIVPFLEALEGDAHISFVHALPALFDGVPPDLTLRSAAVLSGALDLAAGEIGGALAFHTPNAAEFVDTYNALDLPSTAGDDPLEPPLTRAAPVADGLARAVLTIPPGPLDPSHDELMTSRNVFKKLFVGMEALDYAEGVSDQGNTPWVDLLVKSEADEDTPPSPGSVFIRWEFRDQAAIEAFEENELPAGFTLAPTRFLESDDPAGEYFLALNLYNSGGGSIVSGARAEWDVFVHPPEGADPDAGARPRFMIVDALAEVVSADPVNLVTPAEPLSHSLVDGEVVTSVRRFDGDREVPVFESTFPRPDPDRADLARFTREMAIGNDYIY